MSTQEDCAKNFPDDQAVRDEIALLRRVPPWHFYCDQRLERYRPTSAAFEDDSDGDPMSVYRSDVIASERGNVERVMVGHKGFGLVALDAGRFRSRQLTIFPNPLPEETSHAKVCGPKTASRRRWFAKQAQWLIPPPEHEG
ncbi:MAG: hypothetical protein OXH99_00635 [Bryobacterales bacterium]|nr:hypothetical protein [Bryobacterales bacterium]